MIVERLVFQARFGQGDAVVQAFAAFREELAAGLGAPRPRLLVDETGPMFTVVVENEYESLEAMAAFGERERSMYGDPAFQQWFATWMPAVERGSREVYRTTDRGPARARCRTPVARAAGHRPPPPLGAAAAPCPPLARSRYAPRGATRAFGGRP
jgi:hypothetical protein